ncbi:hypothetical protein [Devosia nitrariae]|uniref:HXXEE domain-containing protein n=1 Tax=Devosia nitrariae TaxID=2071872 RepID=A0ABQ5W2D6_9HYPH|nr:hypothetical protein [Devosia nitrariae]GLQ54003.1 hypothetical protein GCM10010862_12620 [Devosia nitrariae]
MTQARTLILPILLICTIVAIGYVMLGPIPAAVFAVAFGGGLILYMATAWRTPFDSRKVIVPYLLTVMLFLVHTYEEYLTDFEVLVSTLAGRTVPEADLLFVIAWLAPFIWVGGAIALIKQWAVGYYFLCAFFIAMTIAELAHFVFPFVIDGTFHYESGMYTAALPLVPAYYGLYVMMKEIGRIRSERQPPNALASTTPGSAA